MSSSARPGISMPFAIWVSSSSSRTGSASGARPGSGPCPGVVGAVRRAPSVRRFDVEVQQAGPAAERPLGFGCHPVAAGRRSGLDPADRPTRPPDRRMGSPSRPGRRSVSGSGFSTGTGSCGDRPTARGSRPPAPDSRFPGRRGGGHLPAVHRPRKMLTTLNMCLA